MSENPTVMESGLPPVAKSFFAFCSKCDADRYHKVVAHTSPTTAKLKCEVCGSTKKYTLPKVQERKLMTRKSGTTVRVPKVISESARASAHKNEYEGLLVPLQEAPEHNYSMKTKYEKGIKLSHPKFGVGVVREVVGDKMDVVFSDEVRSLVHNRA